MGITVITNTSLAASSNAVSTSQPGADSGADFSAMLGLQLANPKLIDLALQVTTSSKTEKADNTDVGATPQDPASLLAAAGLLPGLMASTNQGLPNPPKKTDGDGISSVASDAAKSWPGLPTATETKAGGNGLQDAKTDKAAQSEKGDQVLQDALLTPKANGAARADAANIAADAQSNANNASNFAATLAAQSAAAAHSAQSKSETAAASPQISVPLQDSRWAQDFSDKVVWLAKNEQQTAQININPPQLGPMHITLNLSGDQASAVFVSPHAEVRQAIQDAMPQLREMLAGAGINLGQANVGAQMQQQNSGTPQQFSDSSRFGNDNAILHGDSGRGTTILPQPARGGRGMVDLFA